jgi:ATP-dependent DNA helicase RecG
MSAILSGGRADDVESETVEFKCDHKDGIKATYRLIAEAAVCLANANGGTVVVGVHPGRAGRDAFVGTAIEADAARRQVWELTEPHLLVEPRSVDFADVRLLVLHVPESPEVHSTNGRAPRRLDKHCHDMSPFEQLRLREEKQGYDWSYQPSDRGIEDVWDDAVVVARQLLRRHRDPERQALNRLETADLLRALGATRDDGRLTNAGEMLFCPARDDRERIVYVYRRTPAGEPADASRTAAPLVMAFQEVLGQIEGKRVMTPVSLPRGQQISVEDFPATAIREALSNAVIHRDYHLTQPVHVAHSPQVFEVVSPGPLVAGVTPDNILTHESKPRNPALARAARILGLAEEVGVGVDRMYREMLFVGKRPPIIESALDRVRVTLVGGAPNLRIPYYVSHLPEEERDDVDALLILFTLCTTRVLDAETLAPMLQKSSASAQVVLERLSQDSVGMLEPTRGTVRRVHPKYRLRAEAMAQLGTVVRYNRRLLDELDRKVVAHVQEYGRITNQTVRNLLDVDVYRAADILGDLVGREILVKTSRARRGPSVDYGPGAQFPQKVRRRRGASTETATATGSGQEDQPGI